MVREGEGSVGGWEGQRKVARGGGGGGLEMKEVSRPKGFGKVEIPCPQLT